MSHTADSTGDERNRTNQAYLELSKMMREGRSWSGNERNCAFLNTRGERFATVSATSGFDFLDDARAIALSDWDHDGDVDVWVSNRNAPRLRLMRNESPAAARERWLALRLEGDGRSTNRDAIGARVELSFDTGLVLRKTLRAGEGFLSQSSASLNFAWEAPETRDARVERAVVHWPDRASTRSVFTGLERGHCYLLRQGERAPIEWKRPTPANAIKPSKQRPRAATSRARVPLVTLFRMPTIEFQGYDGSPKTAATGQGKSLLLSLWASWCRPCVTELHELTKRSEDLRRADVEVLALTTDGLGDDETSPRVARDLLERIGFPFASGRATPGLLQMLQHLHDAHLALHRRLPLPSSFLIDAKGRLSVIYKGPVDVDTLLRDLEHSRGDRHARTLRAAAFPGTLVAHKIADATATRIEAIARFHLAEAVARSGRASDAQLQYRDLIAQTPDFAHAHNNLGNLLLSQGNIVEAEASFRRTLEIRDDLPEAWLNLAQVLVRRNAPAEAETALRKAIRLRDDLPKAWNELGLLLGPKGRLEDAERCFRREIAIQPNFAEAHSNLGIVLLRTKRLSSAIESLQRALALEPDYVEAWSNLGAAYIENRQLDEARRALRRALSIDPRFVPALRNLQRISP